MTIGRSHQMDLNRFLLLELGQITQAKSTERQNTQVNASNISVSSCVLPHHTVIKHRIVFDASAKTSNGRSLNDILYPRAKNVLKHEVYVDDMLTRDYTVEAAKLVRWVLENNTWTNEPIAVFYWTDATIVLHWINGDPNRWKTFVANRVAYIHAHSNPHQWRHVSTNDNPADLATRGRSPKELSTSSLWWKGDNDWPTNSIPPIETSILEAKPDKINIHMLVKEDSILNRDSTFSRLICITA
ncbi:uncharacterized protein LOC123037081 [Drosophila rhopaloa]|uniref:Uncharacterized protein n=1 Tax=Drosophila rhopaloa TaxID=1041015 RepID=A0ABM5J100_DRORH|nr:uncharacterized protein LOC123037081 [Drosophila rhopaloa]